MSGYEDYEEEDMYGGSSPFMTYGGAERSMRNTIVCVLVGFVMGVLCMLLISYFMKEKNEIVADSGEQTPEEPAESFWGRR